VSEIFEIFQIDNFEIATPLKESKV